MIERTTEDIVIPVTREQVAEACAVLGIDPATCVSFTLHAGFPDELRATTLKTGAR